MGDQRALVHELWQAGLNNPVVFAQMYRHTNEEKDLFQLKAAADMGPLMIDGLTDGIWLMNDGDISDEDVDATAFGILQAARLRTTKTDTSAVLAADAHSTTCVLPSLAFVKPLNT